jgi:hypothetical protein
MNSQVGAVHSSQFLPLVNGLAVKAPWKTIFNGQNDWAGHSTVTAGLMALHLFMNLFARATVL